jgi:hypothetical protein
MQCVDEPDAAPQGAGPSQQSDQIACGRDISCFVIVSVALAHPNRHPVPALVVLVVAVRALHQILLSLSCVARPPSAAVSVGTEACALTYLVLSLRVLYLQYNQIKSLADATFPASLS